MFFSRLRSIRCGCGRALTIMSGLRFLVTLFFSTWGESIWFWTSCSLSKSKLILLLNKEDFRSDIWFSAGILKLSSKFWKLSFILELSLIVFRMALYWDFRFFLIRAADFNLSIWLLSTFSTSFSSLVKLYCRSRLFGWLSVKNLLLVCWDSLIVGCINRGVVVCLIFLKSIWLSQLSNAFLQEPHDGNFIKVFSGDL